MRRRTPSARTQRRPPTLAPRPGRHGRDNRRAKTEERRIIRTQQRTINTQRATIDAQDAVIDHLEIALDLQSDCMALQRTRLDAQDAEIAHHAAQTAALIERDHPEHGLADAEFIGTLLCEAADPTLAVDDRLERIERVHQHYLSLLAAPAAGRRLN